VKFWKISEFARLIGKHNNTVDGWFRDLESKRIHCISRVNGEKIYDELDLSIAKFIVQHRNKNWALTAIYNELSNNFQLRPFPNENGVEDSPQESVNIDVLKNHIKNEIEGTLKEILELNSSKQLDAFNKIVSRNQKDKYNYIDLFLAERRVMYKLEREALEKWQKKDVRERTIRTGWWKRVEDVNKRDLFVNYYVEKYYEEYLRKELDL